MEDRKIVYLISVCYFPVFHFPVWLILVAGKTIKTESVYHELLEPSACASVD